MYVRFFSCIWNNARDKRPFACCTSSQFHAQISKEFLFRCCLVWSRASFSWGWNIVAKKLIVLHFPFNVWGPAQQPKKSIDVFSLSSTWRNVAHLFCHGSWPSSCEYSMNVYGTQLYQNWSEMLKWSTCHTSRNLGELRASGPPGRPRCAGEERISSWRRSRRGDQARMVGKPWRKHRTV